MTNKSILLVSNYYPPERGAAPNRIQVLAQALQKQGYKVQVVCPLPNYPSGIIFSEYKRKLYLKTVEDNITVHRLWLWPSKSTNKFVRLLSMISFAMSLQWFFILKRIPKTVFIQYSPIFVGFTAVLWSRLLQKKTLLNVSDLWPLAGLEMGLLQKGMYYSVLERMERICYKKAHLILGQSEEILTHISSQQIKTPLFLYRNFPAFIPPHIQEATTTNPIKIVYAGLLGMAQSLSTLLEAVAIPEHIEFHVYGDGPDAEKLTKLGKKQVIFHGTVTRETLHDEISRCDVACIPLVNRIYGSVPSKLFEYSRLGLPLLYLAGGEGERLVKKHQLGWVLPVKDPNSLQEFLNSLNAEMLQKFPKKKIQERAVTHFNFEKQFVALMAQIERI